MTTLIKDTQVFSGCQSFTEGATQSWLGAVSPIGVGISTPFGFSVSNQVAGWERYTINPASSSATEANAAAATIVKMLQAKGIFER